MLCSFLSAEHLSALMRISQGAESVMSGYCVLQQRIERTLFPW